ncbi:MAG TPA: hypothetical protein VKU60_10605, partial [Chloroflexota bacterium]|nr:hypothetical protein [Chloroflexota bacterium]
GESTDFTASSVQASLTVSPATPSVQWSPPASVAYGTPLSSAQLNAMSPVPGIFTYSPPAGTLLDVGSQELSVTFVPTDTTDYTSKTISAKLDVVPAHTKLQLVTGGGTASNRLNATYGDSQITLAAQVSAAVSVDDGMVYFTVTKSGTVLGMVSSPVSGGSASAVFALTGLHAGSYSLLAVYDGSSFLTRSVVTGMLLIQQATPLLTWTHPADISYGTPLSSTQLNATATLNGNAVVGTWTYSPAAGTVLPPGSARQLRGSFKPNDTADFKGSSATVLINVGRAPTSAFVAGASASHTASRTSLTVRLSSTATVSGGSVNFMVTSAEHTVGSVSGSVSKGVASASLPLKGLSAGSYTVTVSYSGSNLFQGTSGSGSLTLS